MLKFWFIAGLCVLAFSSASHATLGEPLSSIAEDAGKLRAAQKASTTTSQYTSSEMYADGNTIKQFANRDGLVFAVRWSGISKPDLQTLFGSYFKEYIDATNETPKQMGVKSMTLKTQKLMVRRSARMRAQQGLAYIPSLVPEGVRVEDLP